MSTLADAKNLEKLKQSSVSQIVSTAHRSKMNQKDIDSLLLVKIALLLEKLLDVK